VVGTKVQYLHVGILIQNQWMALENWYNSSLTLQSSRKNLQVLTQSHCETGTNSESELNAT